MKSALRNITTPPLERPRSIHSPLSSSAICICHLARLTRNRSRPDRSRPSSGCLAHEREPDPAILNSLISDPAPCALLATATPFGASLVVVTSLLLISDIGPLDDAFKEVPTQLALHNELLVVPISRLDVPQHRRS